MLTALQLEAHIKHALGGGGLSSELSVNEVINQAGRFMCQMHSWRWLVGVSQPLALRASITLSGATWTEATKTLTKVGAFATYTHLAGDYTHVTAGTGATVGQYVVASKTSSDAIVLETSIGAAADAQTNIAGKVVLSSCALPADFASFMGRGTTTSIGSWLEYTTLEQLLVYRVSVAPEPAGYYGAAVWAGSTTLTPRLELWPEPPSNNALAVQVFYRRTWPTVTVDTTLIPIPDYMEPLCVNVVRAYAQGYEGEGEDAPGALENRLGHIVAGPVYAAARKNDGRIQPTLGKHSWKHAERASPGYIFGTSQVANP